MKRRIVQVIVILCLILCLMSCNLSSGGVSSTPATTETETSQIQSVSSAQSETSSKKNNTSSKKSDKESNKTSSQTKSQVTETSNVATSSIYADIKRPVELDPIVDVYQHPNRMAFDLGTCKRLSGNPLVVLFFVDDDVSSWDEQSIFSFSQDIFLPALSFIEQEAKKYGVQLGFTVKSYSTAYSNYELKYEGTVTRNPREHGVSADLMKKIALDMGYSSNWMLYSDFKNEHGFDDVIFFMALNKEGTSYASHMIEPTTTTYVENCVLFARDIGDDYVDRSTTVAHEILHLFGAEDYYNGITRPILAEKYYPNDVMLSRWDLTLEETVIDEVTAYSVGWTYTAPSILFEDAWWF